MDETKKPESNLTKRHFARFNERIQNKYAQMQKRMEKSKSMESISYLGEDFVNKKDSSERKNLVKSDRSVKHKLIIENVPAQTAVYQSYEEIPVFDCDVTPATASMHEDNVFFGNNFPSSDNINDAFKNLEVPEEPPVITAKLSVKDRLLARRQAKKLLREQKKDAKRKMVEKVDDKPKTPDKFILSNKPVLDVSKKKNKIASVAVALIEATGPENETTLEESARQFYCRIRLGQEKIKSKVSKKCGKTVSWQELFNLSLFEDHFLEITMLDREKDVVIGRSVIDLSNLEHDNTHRIHIPLEEGDPAFQIFTLITISGVTKTNSTVTCDQEKVQREIAEMKKNFSWILLHDDFTHVGFLSIKIYGAKGLPTSDCYAVFEVGNDRVCTHTEHKTHDPAWMAMYSFQVRDATSILKISVIDEKKTELIAKLAIPLLKIRNGEKKWYALKDSKCRERAKGNNPRMLLEMIFIYNVVKASLRAINTKEAILLETEPDFSRHRFANNINRIKLVINWFKEALQNIKTLFEWKSPTLNITALIAWLIFWFFFKAWMLPLLLLIPFFLYRPPEYRLINLNIKRIMSDNNYDDDKELTDLNVKQSSNNKSLIQKLSSMTEMINTVQNGIGNAASLGESVKNLFNFTEPFLSLLAIFAIIIASVIFFFIPTRYIWMGWGVHKYLRKILRPNRIPNNEILELLSRVPDDEMLLDCQELPLLEVNEDDDFPVNNEHIAVNN